MSESGASAELQESQEDSAVAGALFTIDGVEVEARSGETIWEAARRCGIAIPHLCHSGEAGYRADGNCRACMVEITGERVLAASCIRAAVAGMEVHFSGTRARRSRELVFELLVSDQPPRVDSPDPDALFWRQAEGVGVLESRFASHGDVLGDSSHPAMSVHLGACINCGLCVRACREVQVNDVIGMAGRGRGSRIVFDLEDLMGESSCVACGECVQACPTGALMESRLVSADGRRAVKSERVVDTLCPYCGVGCQTRVHVAGQVAATATDAGAVEERIIKVDGRDGPANENRLCVKGRFGFDYVHHGDRLRRPLIRREGMEKSAGMQIDPRDALGHFREASWEEALAFAASGLARILSAGGGDALAGFGSAKASNEEAYLFQKLIRQGFGSNNVDHCTRLCHASSVAALMEGIGSGAVTAPFTAALESDCIIVIGARPTQNHPVAATYLKAAVRGGAKLILADPRGSELSRHATLDLRFKPGSDVALLNAMLHTIVEEGLTDAQYIQAHTEGFAELVENLRDFSPTAMAEVCGISAERIREAARLYARSRRSIIFWGMGISQHIHGTDNARCLIALALITGQIGRAGTGLHPLRGQNNVQGASDAGLIPMVYPDYRSVADDAVRAEFEAAWGAELNPVPGLTVVEIMDAILADKIRAMYILGENPALSDPDQAHAREALAKLEHLVVQDIFLTETAWFADVVLPASAHAEKTGTYTNTNRQIQMGRRVLRPPGEAREDWVLIQELARRLGLDWSYTHPREVYAEMSQLMPSLANITWERIEREGSVTYPSEGGDIAGVDILFGDGFPTKNGRGRIVAAGLVAPAELPDADYPLVLTTGRLLEHWHTGAMTRRSETLDGLEPEAIAMFNPRAMAMLGLAAGDKVRIATRRGSIEIRLRADRQVPEGVIFIPFCFNEASANLLTNPQLDPMGKIPEFKFCAARMDSIDSVENVSADGG
ncbi:MAG: formate dehydrogenase subunit alpha [Alphaproteobacteria bacterium]